MGKLTKNRRVSRETYLEYDDALNGKSEYYNGEIFDMAGGTYVHGVIANNFGAVLFSALKGTGCRAMNSGVKIELAAANSILYPSLSVVCGDPIYPIGRRDIIQNPILIVEVLSERTAAFDRSKKFQKYMTLKSLREYVLIEQDSPQVDVFFLEENGQWVFNTYQNLDEIVLRSLNVRLSMADIYRDVVFESD